MRLATIDIGTNTTLLLIADIRNATTDLLAEHAEITRLGRGIGVGGQLGEEGIQRTLDVLKIYAQIAREFAAPIFAIGTEALRRAPNAADFLAQAARILGADVEVIDGDREAALTFLAAHRSFPMLAERRMIVLDIGGGSTEVIFSSGTSMTFRNSLPIGSVRLTERYIKHDPALPSEIMAIQQDIRTHLSGLPFPKEPSVLIGTAGTVTSLAAMTQNLTSYDPGLVHGYTLTRTALDQQLHRLATSTQPQREHLAGLDPRRADVILAGACILAEITDRAGLSQILVSDRGIRWGLLYEKSHSVSTQLS